MNQITTNVSAFQKIKDQLNLRKRFFTKYKFYKESDNAPRLKNKIQKQEKSSIVSISDNLLHLKEIYPNMYSTDLDIYQSTYQKHPYVMKAPSSGETSPNDSGSSEGGLAPKQLRLSYLEICQQIIDSQLLTVDRMEPIKVDKFSKGPPKEWIGVKEIMITGLEKELETVKDKQEIQFFLEDQFYLYKFVKFSRFRVIYYKGKLAVTVKFQDENSAQFVYFNMNQKIGLYKVQFGQEIEIFRILDNKTRNPPKDSWIAVFIRHLPLQIQKSDLEQVLSQIVKDIHLEELVQYDSLKYTLVRLQSMEQAETLMKYIDDISKQRNLKPPMIANIHPLSCIKYNDQKNSRFSNFYVSCADQTSTEQFQKDTQMYEEEIQIEQQQYCINLIPDMNDKKDKSGNGLQLDFDKIDKKYKQLQEGQKNQQNGDHIRNDSQIYIDNKKNQNINYLSKTPSEPLNIDLESHLANSTILTQKHPKSKYYDIKESIKSLKKQLQNYPQKEKKVKKHKDYKHKEVHNKYENKHQKIEKEQKKKDKYKISIEKHKSKEKSDNLRINKKEQPIKKSMSDKLEKNGNSEPKQENSSIKISINIENNVKSKNMFESFDVNLDKEYKKRLNESKSSESSNSQKNKKQKTVTPCKDDQASEEGEILDEEILEQQILSEPSTPEPEIYKELLFKKHININNDKQKKNYKSIYERKSEKLGKILEEEIFGKKVPQQHSSNSDLDRKPRNRSRSRSRQKHNHNNRRKKY